MANEQPVTRGTLGLTGLTMNAMALIAPGAFLWLTFQMQSLYGAPMAGSAMWFGIVFALLLCFATAISYSELAKLYPGPGSSYLYAEQAFLSKTPCLQIRPRGQVHQQYVMLPCQPTRLSVGACSPWNPFFGRPFRLPLEGAIDLQATTAARCIGAE